MDKKELVTNIENHINEAIHLATEHLKYDGEPEGDSPRIAILTRLLDVKAKTGHLQDEDILQMRVDWFAATDEELEIIRLCCEKVKSSDYSKALDFSNLFIDIQAVHALRKLNLPGLFDSDIGDLVRELFNIQYHIDRVNHCVSHEYNSRLCARARLGGSNE